MILSGIRTRTALAGALLAALATAAGSAHAATTTTATVTVNASDDLATIPGNAIGLNTAVYDGHMNDAAIPTLLKAAGVTAMRYPGGSYSDIYDWQTNTATGGYVAPGTSFPDFLKTAQATGANPVVTVNYGTGTPSLASAWVQNAVAGNDNVAYWEVGNEVYGNGTYGANWEADSHCTDASGNPVTVGSAPSQTYNCGPATYASNLLNYIAAMKAASPSSHVCAVLTTPGFWPDNVTNPTTSPQPWNQTVLTALGAKTDCVVVHYYPGGSDTASMLTDPADITGIVSALHAEISQYAKVDPASVKIIVTETNSTIDLDTQPAALFAADMYLTWLENGAANVDWWDEHNGVGTPSTVDGAQDYGDQGMFSSNTNGSGVTEPAVDTPFASYYGVEMLSKLGTAGADLIGTTSGNSLVRTHAVRRADGSLAVLIDNEDPGNGYTVNLGYQGFTPSGQASTVYTLANNATSITSTSQSSATSVTVAPYSLTVIQVPGSGGTGVSAPGAPGQPTVSGLTSSAATLNWPAAAAGSNPIADYQVYQQNSGGNTLVATTKGTSVDLTGLTIGTSYTYDVVAVDTQGNASLPSPPVTFTVPPPANADCAVGFAVTNAWSGGYSASIAITNRASASINGWTLTFGLPSGDGIGSGWDGTWSQSGQHVTVQDAGWNAAIPASGGSVSIGFNGTDAGSPPATPVFYLNGNVCASA
jgi:hypothetical protein